MMKQYWFVFDVESIGLHGEGFAVAGGVYLDGEPVLEFAYSCPPATARGFSEDREWVAAEVPPLLVTHENPFRLREAFWSLWVQAQKDFPKILMAGECVWPVEAGFVAACVAHDPLNRNLDGPYPFHDVASIMLAKGMDPMATYERKPGELPAHNPLGDARLSARLLHAALSA